MDMGTDICSDWSINEYGDLTLIKDEDNLLQSIINRLSCYQPSLQIYYNLYGGYVHDYLGRRMNEITLNLLKIEIDTILGQEERLTGYNTSLEYTTEGEVNVTLEAIVGDEVNDYNLIISKDGVDIG